MVMDVRYLRTFDIRGQNEIKQRSDITELMGNLVDTGQYISIIVDKQLYILKLFNIHRLEDQSIYNRADTLQEFLAKLTDIALHGLEVDNEIPLKSISDKRFLNRLESIDAVRDPNYDVKYTSVKSPEEENVFTKINQLNDLVISNTDIEKTMKNHIAFVNGIGHQTVLSADEKKLYIRDGHLNIRLSGKTEILLINTSSLGDSKIIPITPPMITNYTDTDLKTTIRLILPNQDSLAGKYPLVCIGGHLCFPNEEIEVVGETLIKINTNKIDLPHIFLNNPFADPGRSHRHIDITDYADIPITTALEGITDPAHEFKDIIQGTNGIITEDKLLSDAVITNILQTVLSFVILIDSSDIIIKKFPVIPTPNTLIRYVSWGDDTPRGLFRYNKSLLLPYVILSTDRKQHLIFANPRQLSDSGWKDRIDYAGNVNVYEFPNISTLKEPSHRSAELIEFYSASGNIE